MLYSAPYQGHCFDPESKLTEFIAVTPIPDTDIDRHPVADIGDYTGIPPVVDLEGLVQGNTVDERHSAIEQIAQANRGLGFFQIVNHGVSGERIDSVWQETRRFFSRSRGEKEALLRTLDNPWGYYNNELTKNQRDKKEVFDFTSPGVDPIYHASNRWPEEEPFKRVMCDYFSSCAELSQQILQAFCIGLDLPPDFLQRDFSPEHTSFIRLNHYPVHDPMNGSGKQHQAVADLGVHNHTDAGAFTVLLQDDVGGLQVYRDGCWYDVPVVEGAFVVNTGDMMQVWSNDHYDAAIHRVLAMNDVERFSIPFFFNPSAKTTVAPLHSIVSKACPERYKDINWAEFRGARTEGDYANYGTEVQISQYRLGNQST